LVVRLAPTGKHSGDLKPSAINPTFVIDRFGDYAVQLVVSDGTLFSIDTVVISTVNSPPVANAGPDQSTPVGSTLTLNGSSSSDVDGNPLTYHWSFSTKPATSTTALSDTSAVNPTFVVDASGVYVLQLIVKDGTIDSLPDTMTLTTLNSKPVANAGDDQVASIGDVVQLNGSRSTDVDGNPLTFAWSLTTRPADCTLSNRRGESDVHAGQIRSSLRN
jgi:hypothetical protein